MSSVGFLVTELQSLASETRRKHPEIREAAEKALSIIRASPEQATATLTSDGPQSNDLLRPVFMGCATKNAKVVAMSLGSLQRLISLKAVPRSAVPRLIATMNDAMSQGVDIQLRILQTLVSLVPNFPEVHGSQLGEALLLCFKLQESRIAVVSSTAAATLRQLVMFVVDKMDVEDRVSEDTELQDSQLTEVQLPDGSVKKLGPSALDAFSVFEDLCLLANSEKPHFLKLEFLHKTFALELIESVLTNYHQLFRKHNELILLLSHHLCPLLLKSLSDRPQFSLSLRCTRVVFLLLKQFSIELQAESEVFLMLLIRIIGDEGFIESNDHHTSSSRPHWMRVLAMEVMRGLCTDAELIRNLWDSYDAQEQAPKVISSLVTSLKRLVSEKPALLGQNSQMWGLGVQADNASGAAAAAAYGLDMAGRVASATVSGVAGIIGVGGIGLSLQASSMKVQCIDQLDKADAPPIPESYIYLLTLQCIVSLCEGFASFSGPIYTSLVVQRPRAAGEPSIRAPPAFDVDNLPQNEPQIQHLRIVKSIISQSWPALLAALSFIISTNISDELFVEVLASYQAMTNVSGMLGLSTPRDAFFNSLSKFAVPTTVVSSLEAWVENPPVMTPRSTTAAITEGLGLSGPMQPPSLSERNLACLKVFIGCALFLAGSLGESWYAVLDALQTADGVLVLMSRTGAPAKKGLFGGNMATTPSTSAQPKSASLAASQLQAAINAGHTNGGTAHKHPLLSDLEIEMVLTAIQRLFDSSKNLDDPAFKAFVNALCKLSAEMVGMQASDLAIQVDQSDAEESGGNLGVPIHQSQENVVQRRRVSGIYIPKNMQKSGDFGITKLGGAALLNIHRLIFRSPDIAWTSITSHLLMVIRQPYAHQTTRIQAARLLDEILLVVPRNLSNIGDLQAEVQSRVLDVLSQQVILDSLPTTHQPTSTSVELRRMGLETLHQILQAVGHTIVAGWELIFKMLESVCRPLTKSGVMAITPSRSTSTDSLSPSTSSTLAAAKARLAPLQIGSGIPSEKSYSALVKIAFQSLTLVCDSVSSLAPGHLRLCIGTLGQFGRQADTNIALTATASLLWSVSDAIQSKRKNLEEEPEYSGLWMLLLLELLGLCTDSRAEVRDGAIQTLFRTVQLYGATLNSETWDQCIWTIMFPLLTELTSEIRSLAGSDTVQREQDRVQAWDESKILALASIGSIFSDFLVSKIILLDSYPKAWDVFVRHVEETVLLDNRVITPHVLRCLERGVKALALAEGVLKMRVMESLERVWQAIDSLGKSTLDDHAAEQNLPLTQEALIAYVDVIQCVRSTSKGTDGKEWDLPRLTRLMVILKGILTYSNSSDYRPDIDSLSPLQDVVLNTVRDIDLTIPGSPSLVMRDLSQYITLAYLASFDVQPDPSYRVPQTPQKRVTYIAVSKKTMPLLVDLFMRFKSDLDIYTDGTVESVLSAYLIPINMKYDCPAPSRFGKDVPLWKTATNCFLPVVKQCSSHIKTFGSQIPPERLEGIWKQMLDVFQRCILADCSVVATLPLDEQEADENFDFAVIGSLENNVVPHLGDPRLPDEVVMKLGQTLQRGSTVYELEDMVVSASTLSSTLASESRERGSVSSVVESVDIDTQYPELGSSQPGKTVPRERFSYWCLDLLFTVCSDEHKDRESWRMRLAALSLPSLLNRCRTTLLAFVADEYLRGSMPFPRAREEELLYILHKLLELRLWPGSLWAALSDNPTQYCTRQPGTDMDIPQTTKELFADSAKRSSVAHLFHFYPLLCELASVPRQSPSYHSVQNGVRVSYVSDGKSVKDNNYHQNPSKQGSVVERDARHLAMECLKKIGREMGLSG